LVRGTVVVVAPGGPDVVVVGCVVVGVGWVVVVGTPSVLIVQSGHVVVVGGTVVVVGTIVVVGVVITTVLIVQSTHVVVVTAMVVGGELVVVVGCVHGPAVCENVGQSSAVTTSVCALLPDRVRLNPPWNAWNGPPSTERIPAL
jgi:hypothetical protein